MKVYVIVIGKGAFSDRSEEPIKAFMNKEKAQEVMTELESIEAKYERFRHWYYSGPDAEYPRVAEEESKQEYNTLGFDATFYNDWKLYEVELI